MNKHYYPIPYKFPLLLLIVFSISWASLLAQPSTLNFQHLTPADGLSHSDVLDILQDRRGFIWLATRRGLNRYDGHSFTTYLADPQDTTSLSGNWLYSVAEDSLGYIWVTTISNGVCRLDPRTGIFTRFRHDPDNPNSLATDNAGAGNLGHILVDREGIVWISTNAGLERFDPATHTFQHFPDLRECLFHDSEGNLWMSTPGGEVVQWEASSGEKKRYTLPVSSDLPRLSMAEDADGSLLLATHASGIFRLDRDKKAFIPLPLPARLKEELTAIFNLAISPTGLYWIITEGGLYIYNPQNSGWRHFSHDPLDPHTLATNSLLSILIDQEERVWIGSEGGGLNIWDARLLAFEYIQRNPSDPHSLSHNNVTNIYEDTLGNLWVGTWGGGLNYLDRTSGKFTQYRPNPARRGSFPSDFVSYIIEDERGEVRFHNMAYPVIFYEPSRFFHPHNIPDPQLAGQLIPARRSTFQSYFIDSENRRWYQREEGGLLRYDPATRRSTAFAYDPEDTTTLSSSRVVGVYEDSYGRIWVPTWDRGLNLFHPESNTFSHFRHDPEDPNSIPSNTVFLPFEDSKGRLWFGTREGGLSRLVNGDDGFEFITYRTANSDIPGDIITGIAEDSRGYLWISTWGGVCRFDPETEIFKNFNFLDGLASFNWWNAAKGRDGQLYFGCSRGFFIVYPESLQLNEQKPRVFLTDFELNNQPVPIQGTPADTLKWKSPLAQDILFTRHVRLPHHQHDLFIAFTALDYTEPGRNRYRYRLSGYNENWIETTAERPFATYTNLSPGRYTFEVYGANNDGVESLQPATLDIVITPPWYRSNLAQLIYFFLVVTFIWGFAQWRTTALREQRSILEQTVAERTADIRAEQKRSDELLLNILPAEVAQELKATGKTKPVYFEEVSILFADFKGFTNIVATIPGKKLIEELDDIFQSYDDIMEDVGLEKIQTVGDAYIAAGGLPSPDPAHACKCVVAAQKIIAFLEERNQREGLKWSVRIGIHSGPITAGVIGKRKFTYDIFGDTVNVAARIESAGEPGKINVSAYTYTLIQDQFPCTYRGKIDAKGKGELDMYFVDG